MMESEGHSIFIEHVGEFCGPSCPNCKSTNIYIRPGFKDWFWGCYDCSYGFWEQYLSKDIVEHSYKWVKELKDNSEFHKVHITAYKLTREYREKQKELNDKKSIETNKQLSLF